MRSDLKSWMGALILLAGASIFIIGSKSSSNLRTDEIALPALKEQINNIDKVQISRGAQALNFSKHNDSWVLAEAGGYFADLNEIAALLMSLREMKIRTAKTSNPENYKQLQLDEESAIRVKIFAKNQLLEDVYLGKKAQRTDSTYIRKAADKQTWLVSGKLDVSFEVNQWIVKTILNIASDQIRQVSFAREDSDGFEIHKSSAGDAFQLSPINENELLKSQTEVNDLALGLTQLTIESAVLMSDITNPEKISTISYRLFNDESYQLTLYKSGELGFFTLQTGANGNYTDFVKKLTSWAFYIPQYKFDALNTQRESLLTISSNPIKEVTETNE